MSRFYLDLSNMPIEKIINDERYICIAACRVEEDGTDYKKNTPETILAHALWKLTAYGYKDKRRI